MPPCAPTRQPPPSPCRPTIEERTHPGTGFAEDLRQDRRLPCAEQFPRASLPGSGGVYLPLPAAHTPAAVVTVGPRPCLGVCCHPAPPAARHCLRPPAARGTARAGVWPPHSTPPSSWAVAWRPGPVAGNPFMAHRLAPPGRSRVVNGCASAARCRAPSGVVPPGLIGRIRPVRFRPVPPMWLGTYRLCGALRALPPPPLGRPVPSRGACPRVTTARFIPIRTTEP